MANQVDYRDPTPNNFPQDYDPAKADPRVKLRSDSIKHKQKGVDTREAMYQAIEIGSVTANEAKTTADKTAESQDSLNQRVDDQIAANTIKDEEIDFRHSDMLKKTFETMRKRGDFYDNEFADRGVNVKWFGAIGDGEHDDTEFFESALSNGVRLFIPDGKYKITRTIKLSDDLNSPQAATPIEMHGASGNVEIISDLDMIFDFSKSKTVVMSNIKSSKRMKIMNYGESEVLQKSRYLSLKNVLNTAPDGKVINWHNYLNIPAPDKYEVENSSGDYARYGWEIQNWGGFNPLMIVNHSDSIEASPIGIMDDGGKNGVLNSPSILVDQTGGARSWIKILKNKATLFEAGDKHVAIGGIVGQEVGGNANLKIIDSNPAMTLYDPSIGEGAHLRYWGGVLSLVLKDTAVLKANHNGEITEFAPSGISTNVRIRDTSHNRGLQFSKVASGQMRLVYSDADNRLRTVAAAQAADDLTGEIIQTNKAVTSGSRPALRNVNDDKGMMIFDLTLSKPIWWTGSAWVDASGNKV